MWEIFTWQRNTETYDLLWPRRNEGADKQAVALIHSLCVWCGNLSDVRTVGRENTSQDRTSGTLTPGGLRSESMRRRRSERSKEEWEMDPMDPGQGMRFSGKRNYFSLGISSINSINKWSVWVIWIQFLMFCKILNLVQKLTILC